VYGFVEIISSVFSSHTFVLVMFYFFTFVYDTFYGIAGIMDVKKRKIGDLVWILLIFAAIVLNGVLCAVLTQSCSSANCGVNMYFY
jgi:hypothetical protein